MARAHHRRRRVSHARMADSARLAELRARFRLSRSKEKEEEAQVEENPRAAARARLAKRLQASSPARVSDGDEDEVAEDGREDKQIVEYEENREYKELREGGVDGGFIHFFDEDGEVFQEGMVAEVFGAPKQHTQFGDEEALPDGTFALRPGPYSGAHGRLEDAEEQGTRRSSGVQGNPEEKSVLTVPMSPTPMSVVIRFQPRYPNEQARPKLLAGISGSLFALPSFSGGYLRWDDADGQCGYPAGYQPAQTKLPMAPHEDDDTAPCVEAAGPSNVSVISIAVCEVREIIVTGHSGGVVCVWDNEALFTSTNQVLEGEEMWACCWEAHNSPVTAVAITPAGEVWTGSMRGSIRVWSLEAALQGRVPEGYEVKRQGNKSPHREVRFLSVAGNGVVWSAGISSIKLWDVHTKSNTCSLLDEEDGNAESTSGYPRKSALNRMAGRISNIGRGSSKTGTTVKISAMISGHDGTIYIGYDSGMLEHYSFSADLEFSVETGASVQTIAICGPRIWVGLLDGRILICDSVGNSICTWQAHYSAVVSLAEIGSRIASLGQDGSIILWPSAHPQGSHTDPRKINYLRDIRSSLSTRRAYNVLGVTWNVNQTRPGLHAFRNILGGENGVATAAFVVLGLQEIEMGGASVISSAAKERIRPELQEQGNANAQFWGEAVLRVLNNMMPNQWVRVGMRQMSGLLTLVFARQELKNFVGEVETGAVACGAMGVGGNKGASAVRFGIHRNYICVLSSHFKAHQNEIQGRNENYRQISRKLTFKSRANRLFDEAAEDDVDSPDPYFEPVVGHALKDADVVLWMGDFNYRLDLPYYNALSLIAENNISELLEFDQCLKQVRTGEIFADMDEAPIAFPPTYKFDKGIHDRMAYDSSEKQRIPSWTDRIFFRGRGNPQQGDLSRFTTVESLAYESLPDVVDSDHKPVRSLLRIDIPIVNEEEYRIAACQTLGVFNSEPSTWVQDTALEFGIGENAAVYLQNTGGQPCTFALVLRGEEALTGWISVNPTAGVVPPGMQQAISLTVPSTSSLDVVSREIKIFLDIFSMSQYAPGGSPQRMKKRFHPVQITFNPKKNGTGATLDADRHYDESELIFF